MASTSIPPLRLTLTKDLPPNEIPSTLRFLYAACRLDGTCIGWLPFQAYDVRHAQGKILVLHNNDDLVGFVMFSGNLFFCEMRCLQIWIRKDARLLLHGRALIDELDRLSWPAGYRTLRLWCAIDLAANIFWTALGFRYRGWRYSPGKTDRRHVLWMRKISPPSRPLFQSQTWPQLALHPATLSSNRNQIAAAADKE